MFEFIPEYPVFSTRYIVQKFFLALDSVAGTKFILAVFIWIFLGPFSNNSTGTKWETDIFVNFFWGFEARLVPVLNLKFWHDF